MRKYLLLTVPYLLAGCQAVEDLKNAQSDKAAQESQAASPAPVDPTPPLWQQPETGPNDPAFDLSPNDIRNIFGNPSCNAFSDPTLDPGILPDSGLYAVVKTPPAGFDSNQWGSLDKYVTQGIESGSLFVNNINIPTRQFTAGFPTLAGNLLLDGAGHTLFEWFNINFYGFIGIRDQDAEGDYEVALIADDGAKLKIDDHTYINYDGTTASRMMCSTERVNFQHDHKHLLEMNYFQGPRYHIAAVMLWRKYTGQTESLCGQSGNDLFYDSSTVPSTPSASFNGLVARGWSVVPPSAFKVPQELPFNPCNSDRARTVLSGQ